MKIPNYKLSIKINEEGTEIVLDSVRKKWLVATPEEKVRQNWIHHLHQHYKVPLSMMSVESGTKINQQKKRSDLIIFKGSKPFLLLECKQEKVALSQETLNQALTYNRNYLAPFIVLTNGLDHKLIFVDYKNKSIKEVKDLPIYSDWDKKIM